MHEAFLRLLSPLFEPLLEDLLAVAPVHCCLGIVLANSFDFSDHPLQWNIAHLETIVVQVAASLRWLGREKGREEVADVLAKASLLTLRFRRHRRPSATHITVITWEPDLLDILQLSMLGRVLVSVLVHFLERRLDVVLDILGEKRRLELDTALVNGDGMAHVIRCSSDGNRNRGLALEDGNRGDAVPHAEEEDLDVLAFVVLAAEGLAEGFDLVFPQLNIFRVNRSVARQHAVLSGDCRGLGCAAVRDEVCLAMGVADAVADAVGVTIDLSLAISLDFIIA